jgi:metal-sulfur cluster biosynthetic enzyme
VRDEQLYKVDANVVDMGYIYDLRVRDGIVEVLVTMPHPGRPIFEFLVTQGGGRVDEGIYERLKRVDGVREVVVNLTWEPAWTMSRLTQAGRRTLGFE